MALREYLYFNDVKHTWYTVQDSLIGRARNLCAVNFLKSDYDRLMFIDADIEYEPEDVAKVWALDADISVGVYRMKKPGSKFAAWVDGALVDDLTKYKKPISVDYAGTGFMMIKRHVFEKMQSVFPQWKYEEGQVGESWAFFQDPIEDGIHLSEDYFFCKRARELGFKIMMDPSVKLKHWGSFCYGD